MPRQRKEEEAPEGGWLSPNEPDPEGRDLLDPVEYAPACDRAARMVADGSRIDARSGKLVWKWRKA